MVRFQVMSKSLGQPPSVGFWLHTGKNSTASHSKEKEGQFMKEAHSIDRVWAILEGKRPQGMRLSDFMDMGNYLG